MPPPNAPAYGQRPVGQIGQLGKSSGEPMNVVAGSATFPVITTLSSVSFVAPDNMVSGGTRMPPPCASLGDPSAPWNAAPPVIVTRFTVTVGSSAGSALNAPIVSTGPTSPPPLIVVSRAPIPCSVMLLSITTPPAYVVGPSPTTSPSFAASTASWIVG